MAKKQYLDLKGLTTYDEQIKAYIDDADSSHNHPASSINSGTLSSDRLPTVPITKGGTGATSAENARGNLGVYSKTEVDSKVSSAVSGLASTSSVNTSISAHNSSTNAHNDIRTALASVKEDVDAFFKDADLTDKAKDTLQEIQAYITSDVEAAAAMTASINNKADKDSTYTKEEVNNALSGKVSQTAFDIHVATHAPSDAQPNVIETIKVNDVALTPSTKTVNITVPTNTNQLTNGAGFLVANDINGKADKNNTYTKSEVDAMTTADSALSSTSTKPVQNKVVNSAITTATSAISANTNSISAHNTRIGDLETKVGDGIEAIPDTDIKALFTTP